VIVADAPSAVFQYSETNSDEAVSSRKTDAILRAAKKDLLTLMKLDDPSLLDGRVTLLHVPGGTVVSRQGDQVSKRLRWEGAVPRPAQCCGQRWMEC